MTLFKKSLYWATIGLFAYMPFHVFLSQWLSTYTGGLDFWKAAKDVFTALLVSILVSTVLLMRKYTRPYLYMVGFAVLYLMLHIAIWFGTDQPNDTGLLATVYNNRIIWYLLIGYSSGLLLPKLARPIVFAKILLAVSTLVCLVAVAQRFLPGDIMTHFGYSIERGVKPNFFIDDKPDLPRVFSTIRDPNSLGAFLVLPSTLILACLVRFWKTDRRLLFIGLLLLHGLALLLTFSRSAWIGTFVAHAAILAFLFKDVIRLHLKKFAVPIVFLCLLAAGTVFMLRDQYFIQNVVFHADESTTMSDPNELRVELTQKTLDGIEDNPEGHGPGTAGLVSTRLDSGALLTENYYTQIAYEVGVAGLLLFISLLVVIFRILWEKRGNVISQVMIASLLGLSVMATLFHLWSNEAVAVSWFVLAGVCLSYFKERKRS